MKETNDLLTFDQLTPVQFEKSIFITASRDPPKCFRARKKYGNLKGLSWAMTISYRSTSREQQASFWTDSNFHIRSVLTTCLAKEWFYLSSGNI